MRITDDYSHRNGKDILESPKFADAYRELLAVLKRLPPYRASKTKKTSSKHIVAPRAMNHWLDRELCIVRDWEFHPLIIESDPGDPAGSRLRSDYRKARIEVEVQFGNVARYAYDVYKMAISMSLQQVDVGVMVVGTKKFANVTGGNLAYFERAVRELQKSRLTLIVPLVVVGIEPETWNPLKYPSEDRAPMVTKKMINDARTRRGQPPVVIDPRERDEPEGISLANVRRLIRKLA